MGIAEAIERHPRARPDRAGEVASRAMSIVLAQDSGPVRHLVINRPEKRNALNDDVVLALRAAFEAAAGDRNVACVVVRGAGPMFSSGMDFSALGELAADPARLREFRRPILEAWNLLEEMAKPTICQIHGACIGGAMELALACDLRVMAADALIGMPETRIGLIPDVGGSSRLPAIVGLGRAKELVMTGRMIDGAEAHRIGLVNRVASADELEAATDALVAELLACAPVAVGHAKRVLDAAAKPALAATLEHEVTVQELCARTEDFAEGTRAFAERRQPEFGGR
jgi:enoyl-CoA hydratase/carnithine racemase